MQNYLQVTRQEGVFKQKIAMKSLTELSLFTQQQIMKIYTLRKYAKMLFTRAIIAIKRNTITSLIHLVTGMFILMTIANFVTLSGYYLKV